MSGEHLKPKFQSNSHSSPPTHTTPRGKTKQPCLPEELLSLAFCKPLQRTPPRLSSSFILHRNRWWLCGSSLQQALRNLSISSRVLDIPQSQGTPVRPLGCTASSPASPSASTPWPRDRLQLEDPWGHFSAPVTSVVLQPHLQ